MVGVIVAKEGFVSLPSLRDEDAPQIFDWGSWHEVTEGADCVAVGSNPVSLEDGVEGVGGRDEVTEEACELTSSLRGAERCGNPEGSVGICPVITFTGGSLDFVFVTTSILSGP